MKSVLILAFSCLSSLAYGQFIDGQDRGNGGDQCEMRISEIRNEFERWILKGGSATLQLPMGITHDQYYRTMLEQMANATVSCTQTVLTVGAVEKTCLNFRDDKGVPRILCNVDRFMNANESDQYVLIHHEYAGLANFEVNDGERSDYRISMQIPDYYRADGVNKLDIIPAPKCSLDPLRSVSDRMATAIYENKLDCVRMLAPQLGYLEQVLTYRYDPLVKELPNENWFILPPVSFAAILGRVDALNILLEAGFNVNTLQGVHYPLSIAAKASNIESIKALVQRGADLKPVGGNRFSPVDAALSNLEEKSYPVDRIYRTVEALLELGADSNNINFGRTTLSRAVENSELVDLLIKHGASVSSVDKYGRSAIYYCRSAACVEHFVKLGADVKALDYSGSRPIDIVPTAVAVKALLNHGSPPRRKLVSVPREAAP